MYVHALIKTRLLTACLALPMLGFASSGTALTTATARNPVDPATSLARSEAAASASKVESAVRYWETSPQAQMRSVGESLDKIGQHPDPPADPPTVLLLIMDTVRADRTSLCGHRRDTTPQLRSLVTAGHASVSCRAYAPSDWSLPSHASLLTGLAVPEHRAHYARAQGSSGGKRVGGLLIQPLGRGFPTLAEQMTARGYQSVLVSANALLGPAGGLSQGFQIQELRPAGPDRPADWCHQHLAALLKRSIDPDKPLFLVINLLQAHDPWMEPDARLGWDTRYSKEIPLPSLPGWLGAYWNGALPLEQHKILRARLEDLYDYGIYREDAELGRIVELLRKHGRLDHGFRIVITADHGEMLAEHGLWRHSFIFEGNLKIPFVYLSDATTPGLPEPFPAIAAYELLLNGSLPSPLPRPVSVSVPNPELTHPNSAYKQDAAAIWAGSDKLVWMGGQYYLFDLDSDPGETHPLPVGSHPLKPELESVVESLSRKRGVAPKASPELIEQLKALGYL